MRLVPVRVTVVLVLLAACAIAACTDSGGEATIATTSTSLELTTATPAPTAPPVTTATSTPAPQEPRVPESLAGLDLTGISLDGVVFTVAVADTPELRRTGLMFIEDLGDLDGMLFIFEADTSGGFWMKNTLLPLDIAFFDVRGSYVDGFEMEPCTADPCPTYIPTGSYRYAVEMEAGTMPANPRQLRVEVSFEED